MPRRAIISTMLAAVLGVALWAPAGPASAADPCCGVSVSGVPSQLSAGAGPQTFQASFTYSAPSGLQLRSLSAVFTFGASNIIGGQIQLARFHDGRWHDIFVSRRNNVLTGVDNFDLQDGQGSSGSLSAQYRISVGERVPAQGMQMQVTLTGRVSDGHHGETAQLAAAGPFSMTILGAGAPTTKAPTPTPSVGSPSPTSAGASGLAVPPAGADTTDPNLTAAPSSGGSLAWLAYVIGALLLIGGIGVIGTILWKRGNQSVQPDWAAPEQYKADTYGSHAYQNPAYPDPNYTAPTTSYSAGAPAYGAPAGHGPAPTSIMPTQPYDARRPPADPTQYMPRQ